MEWSAHPGKILSLLTVHLVPELRKGTQSTVAFPIVKYFPCEVFPLSVCMCRSSPTVTVSQGQVVLSSGSVLGSACPCPRPISPSTSTTPRSQTQDDTSAMSSSLEPPVSLEKCALMSKVPTGPDTQILALSKNVFWARPQRWKQKSVNCTVCTYALGCLYNIFPQLQQMERECWQTSCFLLQCGHHSQKYSTLFN